MKKLTAYVAAVLVAAAWITIPGQAVAVDSFFDVFFDVEFDPDTRGPSIEARGARVDTSTVPPRTTSIDIEIVALSLVSSPGPAGSTQHEATLSYNIGSSGQDGVRGQRGPSTTAYAELDIQCWEKDPTGAPRCEVVKARSSDIHTHRGHVTVLK